MEKIKKTSYLFAGLVLLFMLAACDIIPEDDRLIIADEIPMKKVVLLEDFTGQRCVNCPLASAEANMLQGIYKENLIVVSIHAGVFALPAMSTPEGDEYNKHFEIEAYPAGVIDRKSYKGVTVRPEFSTWGDAIANSVWRSSDLGIEVEKNFDPETSQLDLEVAITAGENFDISAELALQIWLIESGIVGVQSMPDGSRDREYVHNNIFREAANGTWGEAFSFQSDRSVKLELKDYQLRNTGEAENADIVLFVYKKENGEVLEARKLSLSN